MTAAEMRQGSVIMVSLTLIVDLPALPAGMTSNQFSRYVATHHGLRGHAPTHRDVQTAADITDTELCSAHWPAGPSGWRC